MHCSLSLLVDASPIMKGEPVNMDEAVCTICPDTGLADRVKLLKVHLANKAHWVLQQESIEEGRLKSGWVTPRVVDPMGSYFRKK